MSEIRIDPITGRHVIISEGRDDRPSDFWSRKIEKKIVPTWVEYCPFCKGNEYMTPKAILEEPSGDWEIRVVPNKFPALTMKKKKELEDDELFVKYMGVGMHEVLIESQDHSMSFFKMEFENMKKLVSIVLERYRWIKNQEGIEFVSIFKNYLKGSGASLEHPHTQILGLSATPDYVRYEIEGSEKYYQKKMKCIYCDIIEREEELRDRVIYSNKYFIAIAPFASKYKYETWILPKFHQWDLSQVSKEEEIELADITYKIFKAMGKAIGDFPFNMFMHLLPKKMEVEHSQVYHWHMEIIPRLSGNAGFELGTGIYINTVSPEESARKIREKIEEE